MKSIPFSPPDITEEEIAAVAEVMRSGWITTGPKTKAFEKELTAYCGSARTVCLNSATAALENTLRVLGIGEGDEVIASAFTYSASASAIVHVGATPRLCDVAKDEFFMDPDKLSSMINPRTKAIIATDIGGRMCDFDKIYEIVNAKSLMFTPTNKLQKHFGRCIVIADAAHSLGATYKGKRSGSVADFSCFSFHAVKNLTTAEGGCVTWKHHSFIDDDLLYKQFMLLSLHGQTKDAFEKSSAGSWEYDIIAPYYKCNMTDIMAAIGSTQLKRYDGILARRKAVRDVYDERLCGDKFIKPVLSGNDFESSYHLYQLRVDTFEDKKRDRLIRDILAKGVNCNVHYKPLPMMTAYKQLGFDIKDYPNAYGVFINEITLPLNSVMSVEDANYVCDALISAMN